MTSAPSISRRVGTTLDPGGRNRSALPGILVCCTLPAPGATYLEDASAIFELLSPGTQRRDREEQWSAYRRLPSLQHDILVSRDARCVQHIDRETGSWSGFHIVEGLETGLALPALGFAPPITEVYADVLA